MTRTARPGSGNSASRRPRPSPAPAAAASAAGRGDRETGLANSMRLRGHPHFALLPAGGRRGFDASPRSPPLQKGPPPVDLPLPSGEEYEVGAPVRPLG